MSGCMPPFHTSTSALAAQNERMTLGGSTKALGGVTAPGVDLWHTYVCSCSASGVACGSIVQIILLHPACLSYCVAGC